MQLSKILSSLVLVAAIALPTFTSFPIITEALTKSERSAMVKSARASQRSAMRTFRADLKRSLDERRRNNKAEAAALRAIHKQELAQAKANGKSVAERKAQRQNNSAEMRGLRGAHKQEVAAERAQNKQAIANLKARHINELEPIKNQPVNR